MHIERNKRGDGDYSTPTCRRGANRVSIRSLPFACLECENYDYDDKDNYNGCKYCSSNDCNFTILLVSYKISKITKQYNYKNINSFEK